MKVVVAGGTGWLGSDLCAALAADGHEVVILSRTPHPPARGMRHVAWDGRSAGGWVREVDGADAVINLAGESIAAGRWTSARKARARASRIDPTRALSDAINNAVLRPRLFANVSAVGYYGDRGDDVLTETSPPGDDFLAQLVKDWEATARAAETRVVLLRLGVVLGRNGGPLAQFALPFRFFVGGPIGSGRQWLPWVHQDDVTGAFRFVLDHEEIEGPMNVTAPNPVRYRDFARTLGQVMRRPAWFPVPAFALRIILGELATALLASQRVLPARANSVGFQFAQPTLLPALRQALGARP